MKPQTLIPLLIVLTSLVGCAGSKDSIFPADSATMKSIYSEHFNDIGMRDATNVRKALKHRSIEADVGDLSGYVRDAYVELDTHFPRLPNPTLVMFVFPHLAGAERVPVPGYATTFAMYRQVEYALPGEVPPKALTKRSAN